MSGRYNDVVNVFDTQNGRLIDTIPVGQGPHGLALTPLPARYSDRLADTSRADQDHVLRARPPAVATSLWAPCTVCTLWGVTGLP